MNKYDAFIYTEKCDGGYNVFFENGVSLGQILIKEDGFYDWWPEHRGGFIAAYVLHALADKLDELNEPYERELGSYFSAIEEHRVPVDVEYDPPDAGFRS